MNRVRILSLTVATGILLSACASAPDGPDPSLVIADAVAASDPYEGEDILTDLLGRDGLSSQIRAEAYLQRANLRRFRTYNLSGAAGDLDKMLDLAPKHEHADEARRALESTREQVELHEQQLAKMLTLSQWFDNAWALGQHEAAATRYQMSRLSPTPEQVTRLSEAGFICRGEDGKGADLYQLGAPRDDMENLRWCHSLPEPAAELAEATQNP